MFVIPMPALFPDRCRGRISMRMEVVQQHMHRHWRTEKGQDEECDTA